MTVQEAIKILNPETSAEALLEIEYYGGFNGQMAQVQAIIDASVIAVECMEKQIPKNPIIECFSMGYRRCPNCGEYFDCDEDYYLENGEWHYCGKCGQAIDWGEE